MKLVQLNIWQGRLLRQVVQYLKREQPDFICLQEVYSSELNSPLYDMFRSYEEILASFEGYHGVFTPSYAMDFMEKRVGFGIAIISKYPITNIETHQIHGNFQIYNNLDHYEGNTRTLQVARIELQNGTSFTLVNHHGYWDKSPLGTPVTVQKMETVAAIISSIAGPILFAGDLNVIPSSPALEPFGGMLEDLTATYRLPSTLSSLGKVQNVPCDHIFVSPDITVHSYTANSELVSDHMPVVLDFDIT